MTSQPGQSAENREGRDELGRFVPGCLPGPGRPPVPDFRRVVAERLAANGGSVDAVLYELFAALRAEAIAGNVAAARVLLDRLAPEQAEAEGGQTLTALLAEVAGERQRELVLAESMSPGERAERIRAILASASMREELDRQRPVLQVETGVPPADVERNRSR